MKRRLIIISITLVACVLFLGVSGRVPGADGVISNKTLPDGTKLVLTQEFSSEPGYEVGFYFKLPGEPWGWCYLDHEDTAWWNGRIEYDEDADMVMIWKGNTLRGRWDRRAEKWERPDVSDWISNAPQEMRNPPFGTDEG